MLNETVNIGIVGLGYVGGTIREVIVRPQNRSNINLYTYDVLPEKNPTEDTLLSLVEKSEVIFVCVPTPTRPTGEANISAVLDVVMEINTFATKSKIIVIKSTVPIGTTDLLQTSYPKHSIVYNPEFLTEANAVTDYINNPIIVGKPEWTVAFAAEYVVALQKAIINRATIHSGYVDTVIVTAKEAEVYKYLVNTFLATKVSFANEMYRIAEAAGVDWEVMTSTLIRRDPRLGSSHWQVPGPDGNFGFGGSCFPKDISALIKIADLLEVPTPVLKSVWERNIITDRPERDWEHLKGRAISE